MTSKRIGNILAILLGAFLAIMSGLLGKVLQRDEGLTEQFATNNLSEEIVYVGIIEIIAAILFAIPLTRNLGLLLLSAYFGGAIIFHLTMPPNAPEHMFSFKGAVVYLSLIWIVSWLRGFKFFKDPHF